ncbi:MAG: PorV/PorQ family protein [bacterium]
MRKYIQLTIGLLLLIAMPSFAQSVSKVGTTAGGFLGIDVGPRGNGMGGAYVSVANDATAMYWNPAGIAKIKNFQATFSNTNWIADLSFNYAGAVLSLGNLGTVGVSATFLTMDQMERTTIANPDGTGEMFDAGCYAVGLSYARDLTEQFSIGFNVKFVNERMYHSNANGFALDVGALFDTQFHGLKLGMSITNYGTKMQLDGQDLQIQYDIDPSVSGNNSNINAKLATDKFDLPLMFRVGVSMDVLKGLANSNLILSVDALHPSDDVEYVNLGGEWVFMDMFSLRAGYKQLFAEDSEQGLNFGGGVKYTTFDTTTLYFDYSYVDFGVFDAVHTFSLSLGL